MAVSAFVVMEDLNKYPLQYARNMATAPFCGARFLTIRDLPELLKQHVNGTKALDYGCGPGNITTILKSYGMNVDGVDINEHMINSARKLDPNGKYTVIESAKVPVDSDHYDLVYISYVLCYSESKSEMLTIVKELSRVLKPGGTFINIMNNKEFYTHKLLYEDTDFEENKHLKSGCKVKLALRYHPVSVGHYYWTEEDYCEVISEAGLELVCLYRPLGKDCDGEAWICEKDVPIITMYIARKPHTGEK